MSLQKLVIYEIWCNNCKEYIGNGDSVEDARNKAKERNAVFRPYGENHWCFCEKCAKKEIYDRFKQTITNNNGE